MLPFDPTFVIFSTFDGQRLEVNRYFLQIFNGFYKDILKDYNDILEPLIFFHEEMSFNDLKKLALEINTRHDSCVEQMDMNEEVKEKVEENKTKNETDCGKVKLDLGRKCEDSFDKTALKTEEQNTELSKIDCEGSTASKNETNENSRNSIALNFILKCPYCSESERNTEWTSDKLFAHLHTKHYKELESNISISLDTLMAKLRRSVSNRCALGCRRDFKAYLVEHYKIKHVEDPRICDHCGQSFQNKGTLKFHIRAAHGPSVVCDTCNKVCGNLVKLKVHKRYIHSGKKVLCTYQDCTMAFPNKMDRKKHIKVIHEKQKPFRCDVCGVSMSSFSNIKDHRSKVHKMEKYSSIHYYREIISSGKHPFIDKDSPLAQAVYI